MVTEKSAREQATPLFTVERLCFGYDRNPLFYNVELTVQHGEMIGLLGPNGSGKTTLLRLLSGVVQPQQGHILLQGRDLEKWERRAIARRIAVVPQELHMPFAYTVEQMVDMGRTPFVHSFWGRRTKEDHIAVQRAMAAAGIDTLADRTFNELSGGEQQRVVVAMALAQQPAVLLLDEPTSHLDIKYQIEVLELVRQLNEQQHVTIIAAMHDLNLAARYFSRLILFQRGIVADGSPVEVLSPDLLHRVYDINVQVGILRGSEYLSVLPPSGSDHATESIDAHDDGLHQDATVSSPVTGPAVHIIAGGGSGELVMRALADVQIPFSAGVLNVGDSDHTLALRLAASVLSEQPFAPISAPMLEQFRARLHNVSLLIICPTAIGPGNLALLRIAYEASQQGLSIIILNEAIDAADIVCDDDMFIKQLRARDYTGGEGASYLQKMKQQGAIIVDSVGGVLAAIRDAGYLPAAS